MGISKFRVYNLIERIFEQHRNRIEVLQMFLKLVNHLHYYQFDQDFIFNILLELNWNRHAARQSRILIQENIGASLDKFLNYMKEHNLFDPVYNHPYGWAFRYIPKVINEEKSKERLALVDQLAKGFYEFNQKEDEAYISVDRLLHDLTGKVDHFQVVLSNQEEVVNIIGAYSKAMKLAQELFMASEQRGLEATISLLKPEDILQGLELFTGFVGIINQLPFDFNFEQTRDLFDLPFLGVSNRQPQALSVMRQNVATLNEFFGEIVRPAILQDENTTARGARGWLSSREKISKYIARHVSSPWFMEMARTQMEIDTLLNLEGGSREHLVIAFESLNFFHHALERISGLLQNDQKQRIPVIVANMNAGYWFVAGLVEEVEGHWYIKEEYIPQEIRKQLQTRTSHPRIEVLFNTKISSTDYDYQKANELSLGKEGFEISEYDLQIILSQKVFPIFVDATSNINPLRMPHSSSGVRNFMILKSAMSQAAQQQWRTSISIQDLQDIHITITQSEDINVSWSSWPESIVFSMDEAGEFLEGYNLNGMNGTLFNFEDEFDTPAIARKSNLNSWGVFYQVAIQSDRLPSFLRPLRGQDDRNILDDIIHIYSNGMSQKRSRFQRIVGRYARMIKAFSGYINSIQDYKGPLMMVVDKDNTVTEMDDKVQKQMMTALDRWDKGRNGQNITVVVSANELENLKRDLIGEMQNAEKKLSNIHLVSTERGQNGPKSKALRGFLTTRGLTAYRDKIPVVIIGDNDGGASNMDEEMKKAFDHPSVFFFEVTGVSETLMILSMLNNIGEPAVDAAMVSSKSKGHELSEDTLKKYLNGETPTIRDGDWYKFDFDDVLLSNIDGFGKTKLMGKTAIFRHDPIHGVIGVVDKHGVIYMAGQTAYFEHFSTLRRDENAGIDDILAYLDVVRWARNKGQWTGKRNENRGQVIWKVWHSGEINLATTLAEGFPPEYRDLKRLSVGRYLKGQNIVGILEYDDSLKKTVLRYYLYDLANNREKRGPALGALYFNQSGDLIRLRYGFNAQVSPSLKPSGEIPFGVAKFRESLVGQQIVGFAYPVADNTDLVIVQWHLFQPGSEKILSPAEMTYTLSYEAFQNFALGHQWDLSSYRKFEDKRQDIGSDGQLVFQWYQGHEVLPNLDQESQVTGRVLPDGKVTVNVGHETLTFNIGTQIAGLDLVGKTLVGKLEKDSRFNTGVVLKWYLYDELTDEIMDHRHVQISHLIEKFGIIPFYEDGIIYFMINGDDFYGPGQSNDRDQLIQYIHGMGHINVKYKLRTRVPNYSSFRYQSIFAGETGIIKREWSEQFQRKILNFYLVKKGTHQREGPPVKGIYFDGKGQLNVVQYAVAATVGSSGVFSAAFAPVIHFPDGKALKPTSPKERMIAFATIDGVIVQAQLYRFNKHAGWGQWKAPELEYFITREQFDSTSQDGHKWALYEERDIGRETVNDQAMASYNISFAAEKRYKLSEEEITQMIFDIFKGLEKPKLRLKLVNLFKENRTYFQKPEHLEQFLRRYKVFGIKILNELNLDMFDTENDLLQKVLFLMIVRGNIKDLVWQFGQGGRDRLIKEGVNPSRLYNIFDSDQMVQIFRTVNEEKFIESGQLAPEIFWETGHRLEEFFNGTELFSIYADQIAGVLRRLLMARQSTLMKKGDINNLLPKIGKILETLQTDIYGDLRFELTDRGFKYIKGGVRAGDCSACGSKNYWTQGAWNATFENYEINVYHQGDFFARLLLIVGESEGKPALYVHGVEFTPKARPGEETAAQSRFADEKLQRELLIESLKFLVAYAKRSQITNIFVTGISNSSGFFNYLKPLMDHLTGDVKIPFDSRSFQLLNGIDSAHALYAHASSTQPNPEQMLRIYLQDWPGATNFYSTKLNEIGPVAAEGEHQYIGGSPIDLTDLKRASVILTQMVRDEIERTRKQLEILSSSGEEGFKFTLFNAAKSSNRDQEIDQLVEKLKRNIRLLTEIFDPGAVDQTDHLLEKMERSMKGKKTAIQEIIQASKDFIEKQFADLMEAFFEEDDVTMGESSLGRDEWEDMNFDHDIMKELDFDRHDFPRSSTIWSKEFPEIFGVRMNRISDVWVGSAFRKMQDMIKWEELEKIEMGDDVIKLNKGQWNIDLLEWLELSKPPIESFEETESVEDFIKAWKENFMERVSGTGLFLMLAHRQSRYLFKRPTEVMAVYKQIDSIIKNMTKLDMDSESLLTIARRINPRLMNGFERVLNNGNYNPVSVDLILQHPAEVIDYYKQTAEDFKTEGSIVARIQTFSLESMMSLDNPYFQSRRDSAMLAQDTTLAKDTTDYYFYNLLKKYEKQGANLAFSPADFIGTGTRVKGLTPEIIDIFVEIARGHHNGQIRKDGKETDYMTHLLGGAGIYVNWLKRQDPNAILAFLLHDVVEDSLAHYLNKGESFDRLSKKRAWDLAKKIRKKRGGRVVTPEMQLKVLRGLEQQLRRHQFLLREAGIEVNTVIKYVSAMTKDKKYDSSRFHLPYILDEDDPELIAIKLVDLLHNLRSDRFNRKPGFIQRYIFGDQNKKPGVIRNLFEKKIDIASGNGYKTFFEAIPQELNYIKPFIQATLIEDVLDSYNRGLITEFNDVDGAKKFVERIAKDMNWGQGSFGSVQEVLAYAIEQANGPNPVVPTRLSRHGDVEYTPPSEKSVNGILKFKNRNLKSIGSGGNKEVFDNIKTVVSVYYHKEVIVHFLNNLEIVSQIGREGLTPNIISSGYTKEGYFFIEMEKVEGRVIRKLRKETREAVKDKIPDAVMNILQWFIEHEVFISDIFDDDNLMWGYKYGSKETSKIYLIDIDAVGAMGDVLPRLLRTKFPGKTFRAKLANYFKSFKNPYDVSSYKRFQPIYDRKKIILKFLDSVIRQEKKDGAMISGNLNGRYSITVDQQDELRYSDGGVSYNAIYNQYEPYKIGMKRMIVFGYRGYNFMHGKKVIEHVRWVTNQPLDSESGVTEISVYDKKTGNKLSWEKFPGNTIAAIRQKIIESDHAQSSQTLEKDKAMADQATTQRAPGGIDLNPQNLDLQTQGKGIDFKPSLELSDPNLTINGLTPVIIQMIPINLPVYLGLKDVSDETPLADLDTSPLAPSSFQESGKFFPVDRRLQLSLLE